MPEVKVVHYHQVETWNVIMTLRQNKIVQLKAIMNLVIITFVSSGNNITGEHNECNNSIVDKKWITQRKKK